MGLELEFDRRLFNDTLFRDRLTPYLARRQAHVVVKLGKAGRAEELQLQALATQPEDRSLRVERASLLLGQGRIEAAVTLLDELARLYPDDRYVKRLRLDARTRTRALEEVSRELDLALEVPAPLRGSPAARS